MGNCLALSGNLLGGGITGMGVATVSWTQCWATGMESTTNASVSGQTGVTEKELTLNNHILTHLLVLLASATDLVSEAIALMAKGMAALTHQIVLHPLTLDMHRSVGNVGERTRTYIHKDLPPLTRHRHGCTCSLVKHMLNIISPLNLG